MMEKFIGQFKSIQIKEKHNKFCNEYKSLKNLVNGLKNNGNYNAMQDCIPFKWTEKLLLVIPEVVRRGVFNQVWVIK